VSAFFKDMDRNDPRVAKTDLVAFYNIYPAA